MSDFDIACRDLVEIVTDYLEGLLDEGTAARVATHLEQCPGCEEYIEQMRTTIRLVGRVPVETISPEVKLGLMNAFLDFHD